MKTLTPPEKNHIYDVLAESYIDLVRRGTIGKFERKVVSRKILEAVEAAQSYEDVYTFLNALSMLYPDFSIALVKVKSEISKVHETQVMEHLQSFLKTASG
jgi:hypothetical protein